MTIQFFGLPFLSGKPLPRGNPSCCQSDTPIRSRWTTKSFQLLCVLNAHAHMNNPLSDGRWNDGDAVQQDSPFMRNSNHKIHKMLSTPMGPYQFCRQTNPTFRTPEIRWFPEPLRPCTLGLRHQIKLPGPGGSKIFQNGYQKQHRFCQISSNCCICIKMIHPSKFHMGRSFGTYDIKEVNFRDPSSLGLEFGNFGIWGWTVPTIRIEALSVSEKFLRNELESHWSKAAFKSGTWATTPGNFWLNSGPMDVYDMYGNDTRERSQKKLRGSQHNFWNMLHFEQQNQAPSKI